MTDGLRRKNDDGRRRLTIALATSLALILALAVGCSDAKGASSAGSCSSPGVSRHEVRLGLIYPDTGPDEMVMPAARAGVEARINSINAQGGIHGRRVTLEWRDDQESSDGNAIAAKDLVERAGVFGIIEQSATVAVSADYLAQKGVPVTGIAFEPTWSEHDNMFAAVYPYAKGATTTFGLYARRQGGTRAFLVRFPLLAAASDNERAYTASLNSQKIPVVGSLEFRVGITPPEKVVEEFVSSKADVLMAPVTGPAMASIVAAFRSAGVPLKVAIGGDGYADTLLHQYGAAIAGMTVFVAYTPFEAQTPGIRRFLDAMTRYAPELSDKTQLFAVQGYVSADLFLRGLELAGDCPTRAGFIDALGHSTYDADGLIPSPINLATSRGVLNNCYFFMRVNAAGTGFEPVPSDGTNTRWCGDPVAS
jgi:ABC-type branched-subunit amino acid transport system substrate-binding protein